MSTKDVAFIGTLVTLASLVIPIFIHFNELMHGIQGRLSSVEAKFDLIEIFTRYAIDSVDSQGKSLLYKAVVNEDTEAASALIAAGADVNVRDNQDISPLHIAIYTEQKDIVDELIAAGADDTKDDTKDNQNPWVGLGEEAYVFMDREPKGLQVN